MQIKLADFGFAKFLNSDLLESYCGTPITMAPEILKYNSAKIIKENKITTTQDAIFGLLVL